MRTTVNTVYILKCCVSVAHSWPMYADLHGVADAANLEASARLQVLHFQPHSTTSQPCNDKIGLTLASVMWILDRDPNPHASAFWEISWIRIQNSMKDEDPDPVDKESQKMC